MTQAELDRLQVLQRVCDGAVTQIEAAGRLRISVRQIGRLVAAFRDHGAAGVISKRRGKPPNNRIDRDIRAVVLEQYRGGYHGFGPRLLLSP